MARTATWQRKEGQNTIKYNAQQGLCAISGIPLAYQAGMGRVPTNISIDRIDNGKGYVRDNVQLVCDAVNRMKQDFSQANFIQWCGTIVGNQYG